MKKIDYLAVEYSKKYTKDWDYFIVATEAYRHALQSSYILPFLEDEVEVPEGEQQLSTASFETWRKQNESMSLKDALETYLPWFNFTDLRVHEKDGIISFMGVCKREKEN